MNSTKAPSILYFSGGCENAFDRYQEIFGGELSVRSRYSDLSPNPDLSPIPDHSKDMVMHSTLTISDGVILQGADLAEGFGHIFSAGNNFTITLTVESKSEADRIHQELSQEGKVTMPMQTTFWGSYLGLCTDQYGVNWLINAESTPQA